MLGRCARAGRKGEALSLIATDELCYLLDLHLFLGRELTLVEENTKVDITNHGYFGKVPQILIEEELTTLTQWLDTSNDAVSVELIAVFDLNTNHSIV